MDDSRRDIDDAIAYLADGGMGDVMGFTDIAVRQGTAVQMDTSMALALIELATETLTRRASH